MITKCSRFVFVALTAALAALPCCAATLSISLATNTISEAAGPHATIATVTLSAPQSNAVPLLIRAIALNKIYVTLPTIPAGAISTNFFIDSVNNGDIDGDTNVTLTITADGFNNASTNILVTDDDTPSHRTVGGRLFGTIAGTNTYYVIDNLTVLPNNSLTIMPSANLLFENNIALTNQGTLVAVGLSNAPILFTHAVTTPTNGIWGGIITTGESNATAAIANVEVAYANTGVLLNSSLNITLPNSFVVSKSRLHDCVQDGIRITTVTNSFYAPQAVIVVSNTLYQNTNSGINLLSVVSDLEDGNPNNATSVLDNECYDNGVGIWMEGNVNTAWYPNAVSSISGMISGNYIHGNQYGIRGTNATLMAYPTTNGLYHDHSWGRLNAIIQNNIIANNTLDGINLISPSDADLLPAIVNNTIVGNGSSGIYHSINFTNASALDADVKFKFLIQNNIITQNYYGIQAAQTFNYSNTILSGTNTFVVSNNDVWANLSENWPHYSVAFGMATATNLNGTSADGYGDISTDPLFLSTGGYQLQPNSPAIDAGTTNAAPSSDYIGTSRNGYPDIGAYEFTLSLALASNARTGSFVTIAGGRGTPFQIISSSDLVLWTTVTNGVLTNRSVTIPISIPTNAPRMFFRAQLL